MTHTHTHTHAHTLTHTHTHTHTNTNIYEHCLTKIKDSLRAIVYSSPGESLNKSKHTHTHTHTQLVHASDLQVQRDSKKVLELNYFVIGCEGVCTNSNKSKPLLQCKQHVVWVRIHNTHTHTHAYARTNARTQTHTNKHTHTKIKISIV